MTEYNTTHKQDDPKLIQRQLGAAERYNQSLDFYSLCRKNNAFYHGDQWLGMKTAKIQLMTANFLQRCISYFVSQIVSDDIGFEVNPLIPGSIPDDILSTLPDMVERVFLRNDFRSLNREVIKQGAIECEGVLHWFFDETMETGQHARGDIRCERLSTANVLFGNPYSSSLQDQPYILIKRRVPVQTMQDRAKRLGCSRYKDIKEDSDSQQMPGKERTPEQGLCTEVLKYWKVTSSVERSHKDKVSCDCLASKIHFCRTVGDIVVQADTETAYSLYPVARFQWNPMDGRYHGSCPLTAFIPTQITVNRCLTLVCEYVKNFGLPKIFYKQAAFPNGFRADPTRAYATREDPNLSVYQIGAAADVPAGIINLLDKLVETSRDFMGTSDAALGNIRPDNTSAIVATQKATAAPLMIQTMNFHQFVRDCVRIVIDQIGAFYGTRIVRYDSENGEDIPISYDFGTINIDEMELDVDVGAASYWSELTAIQTADNIVGSGLLNLQDPEQALIWLNMIPKRSIPNRADLVEYLENQLKAQENMDQMQSIADDLDAQQQLNAAGADASIAPDMSTADQSILNAAAAAEAPGMSPEQARAAAEAMTRGV